MHAEVAFIRAFATLLVCATPVATGAVAPLAFDPAVFDAAQASGRPVIVDTFASWCPPCRAQAPLIEWLSEAPAFRGVIVMRLGEHTPRSVWRRFGVDSFGTLIVFRNGHELARGTPVTGAGIARLFGVAIGRD